MFEAHHLASGTFGSGRRDGADNIAVAKEGAGPRHDALAVLDAMLDLDEAASDQDRSPCRGFQRCRR